MNSTAFSATEPGGPWTVCLGVIGKNPRSTGAPFHPTMRPEETGVPAYWVLVLDGDAPSSPSRSRTNALKAVPTRPGAPG